MNPEVEYHAKPADLSEVSKKKKKSKSTEVTIQKKEAVLFEKGTGVLLNLNTETAKDPLLTTFEHGDLELELEVMLPKGSNSGIYLQGRYEIQLFDSWGIKTPSFTDIGGIYRNWESTPGKIYMGKAPLSNPCKAPGLWQHLKIAFQAPRFDASGKKISNARFLYVDLNGIRIHDNIEVPLPTGGPIENNEKALGPLMIQGDHGPVAFRNIRYKLMKELPIELGSVTYKTFYGNFKNVSEFENLKPSETGTIEELTCEVLSKENEYAITYIGNFNVPDNTEYSFTIRFSGGGLVMIDDKILVDYPSAGGWMDTEKSIRLNSGQHTLSIQNFKDVGWMPPLLGIWIRSENSYSRPLHAYGSFPPVEEPTSPILLEPTDKPKLLRAFLDFKNDRSKRLTHTIGVGDPSGIHYVYDLASANIVCAWRGNFVDATPMWHDRGDGSFKPVGAAQYFFTTPSLGFLANEQQEFSSVNRESFKTKGYQIDEESRPVFLYLYNGLEIEDRVIPTDQGRILSHRIKIKERGTTPNLYYKLAEGKTITKMDNNTYVIGDSEYYLKVNDASPVIIRNSKDGMELILKLDTNEVTYSIIW